MVGFRAFGLLLFLVGTYAIGIIIFTRGFLLMRTSMHENSTCTEDFGVRADDHNHGYSGCWMHARFKRAIIIVIDALKYDFIAYNSSLSVDELPYKNKFKTIYSLLNNRPLNTRLYRFMADPPTTTLQRLKGLTTGSLPTFVDAGSNFASSEITEDNFVDQLIKQGKFVKFLGDDTWESLFPNRFYKSFSFPSFNVKDLHMVDDGILKSLYSEIRRRDWDVVIAHFLGVDHCGHRYGPNHPAMADKLSQMDHVIRNITQVMKDDTILFVLGDHGMTRTGDHGGDSEDELSAGLFIYSPAQITASRNIKDENDSVQQTDFVPTLALLLGIPIPFSNLGSIIPELFNHCPWWDAAHSPIRQVFHVVKGLHLNAKQVDRYITAYSKVSSDFPRSKYHALASKLMHAETELQALVTSIVSGTDTPGILDKFNILQNQYQTYLSEARQMCQDVWAKFDITSIAVGLQTLTVGVLVNIMFVVYWTEEEENFPGHFSFVIGGVLLHVTYFAVHMLVFPSTVPPVMSFVIGLLLLFSLTIILKKKVCGEGKEKRICLDFDFFISTAFVVAYFCVYFSNSFVVYEDTVVHFFAQSVLWFISFRVMFTSLASKEMIARESRKARHRSCINFLEWLTQPVVVTCLVTAVCSGLLRLSVHFRTCREEQSACEISFFLKPLSSFTEDASSFKSKRYLFSVVCLFGVQWMMKSWMKYYGNLNGDRINVLSTKFLIPAGTVFCVLYWAVQALPHKELDAVPFWLQTIMAKLVYACILLHALAVLAQPLYVYICHPSASSLPIPVARNGGYQSIPSLYNQLRIQWNKRNYAESIPAAYGLGSAYSCSVVALSSSAYLVLALLLGEGISPSLTLAVLVLFLFFELLSALCGDQKHSTEELQKPVPWIGVVAHGILSSVFFYSTAHQATIPSIRFESAFIGFHGDFSTNVLPALLITLNTFAGPILFTLVFPLMLFWPYLEGPVCKWMMTSPQPEGRSHWRGDYQLFDNGIILRKKLFSCCCRVLLFSSLKLLGAACAATLHRRHLMVWKIFAPRFVFEAATMFVVSTVLVLVFLFILHVDRAIQKLTKTLELE